MPSGIAGLLSIANAAMKIMRSRFRFMTFIAAFFLCLGCSKDNPSAPTQNVEETDTDHLAVARKKTLLRDWDAAAKAVSNALIEDPTNQDALLVAAEIESERGNHEVAAELAGSIDRNSRLGKKAVNLQVKQQLKLNQISMAADTLLGVLAEVPSEHDWRHQAWSLLNRLGRREEASQQAAKLCLAGAATPSELLSLIRRTDSFPPMLNGQTDPEKLFEPGLGMARWHFTQSDFRQAIKALEGQLNSKSSSPAALALFGRLLAETQAFDQIPTWFAKCDQTSISELGDYWTALGTYFSDQRKYEASARALLEAVTRNPTDRVAFQRLAKVFDALGRSEDAAQYRARAIKISDTELSAETLYFASANPVARQQLMKQVMDLERPFETLAWTLLSLPQHAARQRQLVIEQRNQLLQSERALAMASESSSIGVDRTQFDIESAIKELLSQPTDRVSQSAVATVIADPQLENVAEETGLKFQWYCDTENDFESIPIHESVGGGIAVLDFDLDGWPDIYLGQGAGEPPTDQSTKSNVLYRNLNATFRDITNASATEDFNYAAGIAAGDVNQDGFADLYLGSLGHNRLLINNGDGTFHDATPSMGDVTDQFSTSLAIADINGDHLPDLFEAIYIEMDGAFRLPAIGPDGNPTQPSPLEHYAQSDRWLTNQGNGNFQLNEVGTDVAKPGTSLGVIVSDFDGNGTNEIFVGNDVRPNHFLVHGKDNELRNAADALGVANGLSGAANGCMGIASGDFDRNGTLDLHITNFHDESANFYLQSTSGGFTDLAVRYGMDAFSKPMVGFGTKAVDLDRNGWLDLVVSNGHIFDMSKFGEGFRMSPQVLLRSGNGFELAEMGGSDYWEQIYLGRSVATLDHDRNGSIDFLIGHLDAPTALLRNQTITAGHSLQFELVGTSSERDAIGTRIVIHIGQDSLTQWVVAGDGYFASDEAMIDFGIPPEASVSRVSVSWPSGIKQEFESPTLDRRYLIVEGESNLYARH